MNLENGKLPYAMEKSYLPIMITFRYFRFISFIALQNLFFNLEHSREKKHQISYKNVNWKYSSSKQQRKQCFCKKYQGIILFMYQVKICFNKRTTNKFKMSLIVLQYKFATFFSRSNAFTVLVNNVPEERPLCVFVLWFGWDSSIFSLMFLGFFNLDLI